MAKPINSQIALSNELVFNKILYTITAHSTRDLIGQSIFHKKKKHKPPNLYVRELILLFFFTSAIFSMLLIRENDCSFDDFAVSNERIFLLPCIDTLSD